MKTLVPEKTVCPKFVLNESLNNVSTEKQFDVHIILFDENAKQVKKSLLDQNLLDTEIQKQ